MITLLLNTDDNQTVVISLDVHNCCRNLQLIGIVFHGCIIYLEHVVLRYLLICSTETRLFRLLNVHFIWKFKHALNKWEHRRINHETAMVSKSKWLIILFCGLIFWCFLFYVYLSMTQLGLYLVAWDSPPPNDI